MSEVSKNGTEQGLKERQNTRNQRTEKYKESKNGKKEIINEMIKKLKEENISLETIIKITGLSENEILQICNKK